MQGKKMYLPGITKMFVETMDDIQTIMTVGDKNRSTAATKMNSTRSVCAENSNEIHEHCQSCFSPK